MTDGFFTTALTGVDLGLLLIGHATQKLFGWFRGADPAGTGAMFEAWASGPDRS